MRQKTELEKLQAKAAKSAWNNRMRAKYPDFTPKKWARNTYRMNHGQ